MAAIYCFLTLLVAVRYSTGSLNVARYSASPVQYHIQTDTGDDRYFRYETTNGQWRKEKRLRNGRVVGAYGWTDGLGVLRLYDYLADQHGYRVVRERNFNVADVGPYVDFLDVDELERYLVGSEGGARVGRDQVKYGANHVVPAPNQAKLTQYQPEPTHNQAKPTQYQPEPTHNQAKLTQYQPEPTHNQAKSAQYQPEPTHNQVEPRLNHRNQEKPEVTQPNIGDFGKGLTVSRDDRPYRNGQVSIDNQRWYGGSYAGRLDHKLSSNGDSSASKRRKNYQKARNYTPNNAIGTTTSTNDDISLVKPVGSTNFGRNSKNEIVPVAEITENEIARVTKNDKRDKRRSNFDKISDAGERRKIAKGKKLFPILNFPIKIENNHIISSRTFANDDNTETGYDIGSGEGISATNDGEYQRSGTKNGILDTSTVPTDGTLSLNRENSEEINAKRVHAAGFGKNINNALLERSKSANVVVKNTNFRSPSPQSKMNFRYRVPMSRQLRAKFVASDSSSAASTSVGY